MFAVTPKPIYIVESPPLTTFHDGVVDVESITEQVYGRRLDAAAACRLDSECRVGYGHATLYRLSENGPYEMALSRAHDTRAPLGFAQGREQWHYGHAPIEYWTSIGWVGKDGQDTVRVPSGPDFYGAVFADEHAANRAFTPSLETVLADLISARHLPRGDYLYRYLD